MQFPGDFAPHCVIVGRALLRDSAPVHRLGREVVRWQIVLNQRHAPERRDRYGVMTTAPSTESFFSAIRASFA